ncbi:MAG: histidinol-phosphate transaminase [Gammaproteobacteria bacterium]|jgi:histidinol-phosphate aminotransferase
MTRDQSLTELAAAAVSELAPYQPGKPLAELERDYGVRDAIKLASNENPMELPAAVRAAIRESIADVSRYPDGAAFSLRGALAQQLGVVPDAITLGNGSNEVLVLLAETFLTPQVNAIYDQYSFVVYRLVVQATGAEARVAASLPRDHEQPLGHDLDAMLALVDANTRLVFIANPNNPTGTWLDGDALHAFLAALPAHVVAVVDEAYYEYARDEQWPDVLSWLVEFPNLVVTRTFSKAYGLAGLRLGYGVSSPAMAELLNRVRQPFNVNAVAQAAALAALNETSWLAECRAENDRELKHVIAGLAGMGIHCSPSKGNFVLAEIPNAGACNEFLLQRGIIVRPVANYGLDGYLRISIGNKSENHRLLAGVSAYMESRS